MIKKVQVWIIKGYPGPKPKLLMLKVVKARGAGWHPVTGSVEAGESLIAAAIRETEEETGIVAEKDFWVNLKFSCTFQGRWGKAKEHAFGLYFKKYTKKIKLDPTEHQDQEWVSVVEAKKRIGFESQANALQAFLCYLGLE